MMKQRAEQLKMEKQASIKIENQHPIRKMSLKEFVLGVETETEEDRLRKQMFKERADRMLAER